ncbi:uncharacterized protein MONBRDRAFT_10853 [Monosiga brevicollis MX1]|uniref:Translation initiation factor eIF2B subunit delta n=1 Tax=Monosiga brevicollis TaxID=81824 RepID=A9V7F4_MONBE|nr:uncharacterized protein MONBRDRAFT_10853 [Monosiga brevicollis MX1]EDQ86505.1 predicted protein [Monosiga brevicollis MX1]|eukprot:XP_001748618.1 hypothetical protein [Monosiga brevicollis MX1]
MASTPALSVPSQPKRTVVGFGPGSLTTKVGARLPAHERFFCLRIAQTILAVPQTDNPGPVGTTGRSREVSLSSNPSVSSMGDSMKKQKQISKSLARQKVPERETKQKQVSFFSHLKQYEHSASLTQFIKFDRYPAVHPAILRLGLQMSEGLVEGSTMRCVQLLYAIKELVKDYSTPDGKELSRDLTHSLNPAIRFVAIFRLSFVAIPNIWPVLTSHLLLHLTRSFLTQCRPLSTSMGNAIKALKRTISEDIPADTPEAQAKDIVIEWIDNYIRECVILAHAMISEHACNKINNGDTLLVHGASVLLNRVLRDAHKAGVQFQVVVVDSRPSMSGRKTAEYLATLGIPCTYILISAISYVMRNISKVFLSAEALLANGYFTGAIGSSMIAMMAKAYNVPVLLCCETYKFCERVQTDSIVTNELGDPTDLAKAPDNQNRLVGWQDVPSLKLLNLVHDLTPSSFVDMVVTEIGMIPCTSVPVVLRVRDEQRL